MAEASPRPTIVPTHIITLANLPADLVTSAEKLVGPVVLLRASLSIQDILHELLGKYGTVHETSVDVSACSVRVVYMYREEAVFARLALHNRELKGQSIRVSYEPVSRRPHHSSSSSPVPLP